MPTPETQNSTLFKPLKVGDITLKHRLVLAPLTRWRATKSPSQLPLPIVKTHYAQRAIIPGTLLISEATFISPQAVGQPYAPGIWSPAQIHAWKAVTDAVHAAGSFIYCQLWHNGRAVFKDSEKLYGLEPISASSLAYKGQMGSTSRTMNENDIKTAINEYATAARNAIEAGFDGVEIHAANGYLIDQFLQSNSNNRDDAYGGSIGNRSRFALEVTKACIDAVGASKVGIRLSPLSAAQGMRMKDEDIKPQFENVIIGLKELGVSYLHLVEGRVQGTIDSRERAGERIDWAIDAFLSGSPSPSSGSSTSSSGSFASGSPSTSSNPTPKTQKQQKGVVLLAGGYQPSTALQKLDFERPSDDILIVFGRLWTSNPDLVYRIREGIPLRKYERKTFYNVGEERGYTDWEYSDELKRELGVEVTVGGAGEGEVSQIGEVGEIGEGKSREGEGKVESKL